LNFKKKKNHCPSKTVKVKNFEILICFEAAVSYDKKIHKKNVKKN